MAKVHFVKKALKDNPKLGIKKGESYYWWKFRTNGRGGAKRVSRTRPRPSQLTQSEYLSRAYGIQEETEDLMKGRDIEADEDGKPKDKDAFEAARDEVAQHLRDKIDEVRELGEEQDEKLNNMPDSLQQGSSGEMLQGRVNACESLADEIESAADEVENAESWEDVEQIVGGISWTFEE